MSASQCTSRRCAAGRHPRSERFVFVRDGFHFWAFVLGPLWLAWHRLWLALIGYLVAGCDRNSLCRSCRGRLGDHRAVAGALVGFEAGYAAALQADARGWNNVGVVVATISKMAERRFFAAWLRRTNTAFVRRRLPAPAVAFAGPRAKRRRKPRCRRAVSRAGERRGERCHRRLRLRQSALGGEGVRARRA